MKKFLSLFTLIALLVSCNKDLVEKPDNLIDKKVMGDILYDISILEALKYQNQDSLYTNGINPKTYIYKKYKIDSLQFAKSNAYYASDYREYKKMYDALSDRLKKDKEAAAVVVKKERKREEALKKAKAKKVQDSIKKVKEIKELKIKKDSITAQKKKDSIAKKKKSTEVKKIK